MKCDRCGKDVPPEETVPHGGRTVCEDCLMSVMSPAKACDPWAVKMAKGSITTASGGEGELRGLEKRVYDLVCAEGKVPKAALLSLLNVSTDEMDRALAVLRHMELLRGQKELDGTVVVTTFSKSC